ncbi:bifunctional 4-hydroxy-2-oxoglutarate aldolase/2-dehydro-3-deoxy-phosphogluconate aldolase [Nocardia sp. NEAU-G5]|uniref:Bifunctional 4-hydroxy-2-oxoglutarate aldolase/2-dehydro-3-deoxy-phosphogluconate aldolase n=1 Tax=Nocardia albiluteola TaxID=2842303 RepID=A0ABS6B8A9_9NOCA|nr:bifunctional 4-hydroxy-2-oxoglutarate aldolase/2-dehydro-3-deoxy-phosphogluconate aldolase [Nocardia albiluteola]MBU3066544.1 bifunctional 4-hydroxy-2-oxoglutarate aldolase/2-dehydro-3-deoxy-phosphogluconate aldolase [Nocardia albiluteola]
MIAFEQALTEHRLVAILRAREPAPLVEAALALIEGGVRCLEITLPSPGSLPAVRMLADRAGSRVCLGVGTVLTASEVAAAADAGARFVVAPNFDPEVVAAATAAGLGSLPGAYTPTEIVAAWRAGATAVKLFPAATLGPEFVASVRAPLPEIPLVAVGGVGLAEAKEYLDRGALAVGVGSPLLGDALRADAGEREWAALRARAAEFVAVTADPNE